MKSHQNELREKSESESIESHQNGRKISPEVLPTLPWTQHHQPDIRVPPTENNSRSGNLWFSFNVFFHRLVLSLSFSTFSMVFKSANWKKPWSGNFKSLSIFFLLGYFKSYQSSHFSLVIWRSLLWWNWKIFLSLNILHHRLLILKIR